MADFSRSVSVSKGEQLSRGCQSFPTGDTGVNIYFKVSTSAARHAPHSCMRVV